MNVIVICSDTFRYDHLGFLKKQPVLTPNLDRLAAESACFSDFWLCSFPTLVHRIEVFTGRYTFPLFNWGTLPRQYPVLSEVFKHHGFTTALVADNLHLFEDNFGFSRGFDFAKNIPGQTHDPFQPKSTPMIELSCPAEKLDPPPHRLDRYRRNAFWYQQQGTNTTIEVFREAMRWLERPPQKFFLWIDAFDPHEPWDAPAEHLKPYPWNEQAQSIFWPKSGSVNQFSTGELTNMRSLYKAEVTQIDHWVGQLLDQLRSQHLLDNTAILFTSDHGFYFGEHDLVGKPLRGKEPTRIYEELGHIPLLLRHPQGLAAGKTISGLTQPPDIYHTVLELAGIPNVPWAQGWSLVPRLRGEPSPQKFAVGGCFPHKGRVACLTTLTNEWCMIHSPMKGPPGAELFHIPVDPKQTRNVAADHRDVVEDLHRQLAGWFDGLGVSAARKEQLLQNAPFPWHQKWKYKFWLQQQSRSYSKNYSNYAAGKL